MDEPNGTPLDVYARRIEELEQDRDVWKHLAKMRGQRIIELKRWLEEARQLLGQIMEHELGADWCNCDGVETCRSCRVRALLDRWKGDAA